MPISVKVFAWIMMLCSCTGLIYNLCEYVRFLDSSDWTSAHAIVVEEAVGRNAAVYQIVDEANGVKTSKIGFGIATRFPCCLGRNQRINVMASPNRDRAAIYREYIGANWFVNALLMAGSSAMAVLLLFVPREEKPDVEQAIAPDDH